MFAQAGRGVQVGIRDVARRCALAGLVSALAVAGPAVAGAAAPRTGPAASVAGLTPSHSVAGRTLPRCAAGSAPTTAPVGRAGLDAPRACQADTKRAPGPGFRAESRDAPTTAGYHHLGAGTGGGWGGVSGRIAVTDPSVRRGTYDFVASRFMVKRDTGGGRIAWLEAGWAETGWAGAGRQQIYTFDTNTGTWQFYDQYRLRRGDRVWLDVHTDGRGVWQAWLWWNNRWNLLTSQRLPLGGSAYVEQYVEVHVDPAHPARITVPTVAVDNVQLLGTGGGGYRYWRENVRTATADPTTRGAGFCVDWVTRFDTWTAGDCTQAERRPLHLDDRRSHTGLRDTPVLQVDEHAHPELGALTT